MPSCFFGKDPLSFLVKVCYTEYRLGAVYPILRAGQGGFTMSVKVITVGREFGSGGRSVGKAVAAALGWDYYDQELVRHVAEKTGFAERYIEETGEYPAARAAWPTPFIRWFAGGDERPVCV